MNFAHTSLDALTTQRVRARPQRRPCL